MRSRIYEADQIQNLEVEFGEAAAPRHVVVYVNAEGTEEFLLLTQSQVDDGKARARREPRDIQHFIDRYNGRQVAENKRLLANIAVVLFVLGTIGLIIDWGGL